MHLLSGNYRGTRRAVPATQNYRRPEVGGHLSAEGESAWRKAFITNVLLRWRPASLPAVCRHVSCFLWWFPTC